MAYLPAIFNVLVDEPGHAHGDEGVEPRRHEHDGDAQDQTNQG